MLATLSVHFPLNSSRLKVKAFAVIVSRAGPVTMGR